MEPARIAILLPYKEHFCACGAGAVALCVRDTVARSHHAARIDVLGRPLRQPFPGFAYHGLTPAFAGLAGRNLGLAERLCRRHGTARLIEVHNRPRLLYYLALRLPGRRLTLHLHNDPETIELIRTPGGRARVLRIASAVYCVSAFIRTRFVAGLERDLEKVHVIRNGIDRSLPAPPAKDRLIVYAGRLIEEKGVLPLLDALAKVLPQRPGWRVLVIGAGRAGGGTTSPYEAAVEDRCRALGPQVERTGFLPQEEVMAAFARAAIAVVPSLWAEPISRTAIEALAAGCAVVASPRGGLAEVVTGRGLLVEPERQALATALARLMDDPGERESLAARAWADFPFTAEAAAHAQDRVRSELLALPARGRPS